jgi:hypothetical protein
MTERIGVIYLNVPFTDGSQHLALFYEKADGQKTVIEFGPTIQNPALSAQATTTSNRLGLNCTIWPFSVWIAERWRERVERRLSESGRHPFQRNLDYGHRS